MGDLIRREDAFKAILGETIYDNVDDVEINCGYSVLDSEGWIGGIRDALRAIEYIPSAEPERKKGEWIKEDLSGYLTPGGNSIYHCSECGHTEGPWPHPRLTNFCPNCGADMRGE